MPEPDVFAAAKPSIDDIFREEFGAVPTEPVAPEPDDEKRAAGAPPAEPLETPAPESADPSDPATPGTPSTPSDPADATDPPDDDLPASQPFTYTVDGQSRTWADIDVIPGHGAIIPEAAIGQLQQRLAERDNLYERQQQQYQQVQDLERVTAWQRQGANGQPETVTGRQAEEAKRVDLARALVRADTLEQILSDPVQLASLLTLHNNQVTHDPLAIENLRNRVALVQMQAEQAARQHFNTTLPAQNTQVSAQNQQIDWQQVGPLVVDQEAQVVGVTGLTPDDKTFLATLAPRFVREATLQDAQANPTVQVGQRVIDGAFRELIKQQSQRSANAVTTSDAASKATAENKKRLEAAAMGKTVVKQHTRTVPNKSQDTIPRRDRSQDAARIHESLLNGHWPDESDDE